VRGTLHLVCGPSGVGKDTLIAAAARARPDLVLPRRVITRPAGAGGEDHAPATPDAFDAMEADGAFLLSWRAHGLAYGVPASAGAALAEGRHVLANVSRGVVGTARARHLPVRVLLVTAPAEALARRLAARGREAEAEIARRLARAELEGPTGPDVRTIVNDDLPAATAAFLAALAPPLPAAARAPHPEPQR
jgi:ribose 1,5-bisphosphokinase